MRLTIWSRVCSLLQRRRVSRELCDELEFHLAMETEANLARGMTRTEARRAALRDFGGFMQTVEAVRGVRAMWLDFLARNLHLAFRRIRRQPIISACVVLLVALGVAAVAVCFSVVDAVLLKPLPFRRADDLIALGVKPRRPDLPIQPISPRQYFEIRDSGRLASVAVMSPWEPSETPEDVGLAGADVTPSLFDVLGEAPVEGRALEDTDATVAEPRSVVVGYGLFKSRFGGDRTVLGRTLTLGGRRVVVVGVMPPGFDFPAGTNIWAAAVLIPKPGEDTFRYLQAVGRVPPATPPRRVGYELTKASGLSIGAMPLRDWVRPPSTRALALLILGASFVLLLTWVEVAFLQLTRAAAINRELGLRLALGASRRQVLAQCAVEGGVLAALGLASAWLTAPALLSLVLQYLPMELTRGQHVAIDLRVLALASVTSVFGAMAFTVVPAYVLRRTTPAGAISGSRGRRSPSSPARLRTGLLIAQITVSSALVYLGGLTLRTYQQVDRVNPGFQVAGLTAISLPRPFDEPSEATWQRFQATVDAVRGMAGVRTATGTVRRPFGRGAARSRAALKGVSIENSTAVSRSFVAPAYFATVGGGLVAGREFDDRDVRGAPLVVILNQTAAQSLGIDAGLVDREILIDGLPTVLVGIARDMRMVRPDEPPRPEAFSPCAQWLAPSWLLVRTDHDAGPLRGRIRNIISGRWTTRPPEATDVAEDARRAAAPFRMRMQVLLTLAATGLLLATVGLYGGVTFVVGERTHDYAIRMTLGASPAVIRRDIFALTAEVVLAGVGAGLAVGGIAGRLLPDLLFNVSAFDWMTASSTTALAVGVALGAAVFPATRAGRIQPAEALHRE